MLSRIAIYILTIFSVLFIVNVNYCYGKNTITGKWIGKLDAGGNVLRIVFNISPNDKGEYSATLDSPDQGANGIPVTEVIYQENKLTLSITAIAGKYEGTISEDGQTIKGTWIQGTARFPLNMEKNKPETAEPHSSVNDVMDEKDLKRLSGKWLGTLKVENAGVSLRLVFNFSAAPGNTVQATLDSPDQGATGIPVSKVEFVNNHINVEVQKVAGKFEGDMYEDNMSIKGTWSQGGNNIPLLLKKVEEGTEVQGLNRPQEPKEPYPYLNEEVAFPNSEAGIKLAGTLTIPKGKGPFPAVILITGSGAQDRNETFMTHKPFLVWADHLTRKGIAVLRCDDRGFGKSTGDFSSATSLDFVKDALAAVEFLKTRPEIDVNKIGLVGHSEGGLIAPIAAVESRDIAFIALMAGPGIKGSEVLLTQQKSILETNGISEATINAMWKLNNNLFNIVQTEKNDSFALTKLRITVDKTFATLDTNIINELNSIGESEVSDAMLSRIISPWFRYFLIHDPQKWLERVTCPVLALNGEKDVQVTPKENLPAIEKALKAGMNKNYTIKELPGLNHLFQRAETGAVSEYSKIEETISPEVLELMSDWINTLSR